MPRAQSSYLMAPQPEDAGSASLGELADPCSEIAILIDQCETRRKRPPTTSGAPSTPIDQVAMALSRQRVLLHRTNTVCRDAPDGPRRPWSWTALRW